MRPTDATRGSPQDLVLLDEILRTAARRFRTRVATWRGKDVPIAQRAFRGADLDALLEVGENEPCLWAAFAQDNAPPVLALVELRLLRILVGQLYGSADDELVASGEGPTEVERSVGTRICREIVESICAGWTGGGTPPRSGPRFVVAPSARVCRDVNVDTAYNIGSLEISGAGMLHIGLPAALDPRARAVEVDRPAPEPRLPRFDRVWPVQVEVVAEIARMQLPLGRVLAFAVGDELLLGTRTEATLRVGERAMLVGEPGERGGVRSVRVTGRCPGSIPAGEDR